MEEFIDYDFTKDKLFVPGDLGLGDEGKLCGAYEDSQEVYDYSRIDEGIEKLDALGGGMDQLVVEIKSQLSEGSCVSQAFTQSNQVIQALQYGKDKITKLSAISLYKRIGRSPGSGAMVSDGIAEMRSRGILPLNTEENKAKYKHTMPNTGFYTPFPQGWEETAALFKGDEYYIVRTPQALFTALLKGCPVVVGRSGHSICYVRPMRKNGQRVVKYANSWSTNWGDAGFGYDSSRMIAQSAQWAVAVVSTVNQRRAA